MFPELQSQRFLLQEILPGDQAFIFEGLSHPEVIPFYGVSYDSFEATKTQMKFYQDVWQNKTGCWWKIVDKETGSPWGLAVSTIIVQSMKKLKLAIGCYRGINGKELCWK